MAGGGSWSMDLFSVCTAWHSSAWPDGSPSVLIWRRTSWK